MKSFNFTSSAFKVIPSEDKNINPGVLGKALSEWIANQLNHSKYEISEVLEEDFGYCLMVKRDPYWLWIGCAGFSDFQYPENGLSEKVAARFPLETIEWSVWVTTERGWLSRLFNKDNRDAEAKELEAMIVKKLEAIDVKPL